MADLYSCLPPAPFVDDSAMSVHTANAFKIFVYYRQTIDVGKIKKILEPQPSQEDIRTLPGSRS